MVHTIKELFEKWSGESCTEFSQISAHGSNRTYYRLKGNQKQCLAAYNECVPENRAFIRFTQNLKEANLPVPEIYAVDSSEQVYLLQDLGDKTLYACISSKRETGKGFDVELENIYSTILDDLIDFQLKGKNTVDFSYCYPRNAFDEQSMLWDLNYFKYYFLKLADISFDEQELENDFQTFINFLLQAPSDYFLYRDFQSRNIMIVNETPFYIDYQGGRKGALQYDLASLLYDAKAEIPQQIREKLLNAYIEKLSKKTTVDKEKFIQLFYGFVFIRIMQAMGAYGFRGFYERKTHFLQSIPPALENLKWLLKNTQLPIKIPALQKVWQNLCDSEKLKKLNNANYHHTQSNLTVSINSFSFRTSIPTDNSGNGGGFVFDCRALPNPGRYEEYKTVTGKDKPVIDFLDKEPEVAAFLKNIYPIVEQSVKVYTQRGFEHLMVNFGCTGGQHRSVYCAEHLAEHLVKSCKCTINLHHIEQEKNQA